MGLVYRNSNVYYYESRRTGSSVASEYKGAGPLAQIAEQRKAERMAEDRERRATFDAWRAEVAAVNAAVDHTPDLINALAEAEMVRAGFHRHKRQWRKRRRGSF